MQELTERQEEMLKAMTRRMRWRVAGNEVCARVGDLEHWVKEASGEVSMALVVEAEAILRRFFRRRLGELIRTGRIETWPAIRLINGMPTHIEGVDGVHPRQIPKRLA